MIKNMLSYLRWLFSIDEKSVVDPPVAKKPLTADQKEALESKQLKEALNKALSKKLKNHGNISTGTKEVR